MLTPKQRTQLIRRRGGTCNRCGKRVNARTARIHHKNRDPNDDRTSNLRVLCKDCHDKLHARRGERVSPLDEILGTSQKGRKGLKKILGI